MRRLWALTTARTREFYSGYAEDGSFEYNGRLCMSRRLAIWPWRFEFLKGIFFLQQAHVMSANSLLALAYPESQHNLLKAICFCDNLLHSS